MRLFILLTLIPFLLFAQTGKIFPDHSKPVEVFSSGYFTEGPACGPDGCIYFSDQTFTDETDMEAGIIWKYDPAKDTTVVFRSPSGMSNGIAFDKEGRMIVCEGADYGGRMIVSTEMVTGKSKIIAGLFNGKPFNSPNDLAIDSKGRIYFTDPRYAGHESIDQQVMGVYRIDNNKIKLLIKDIPMPNGIALSPDEKILYIGCNYEGVMAVYKYDITEADSIKFNRVLIEFPGDAGPDGIKVNKAGNLFIAIRDESKPQIRVYNPEGKLLDSLYLPAVPSNLVFTPGEKELYITAGGNLYRETLE